MECIPDTDRCDMKTLPDNFHILKTDFGNVKTDFRGEVKDLFHCDTIGIILLININNAWIVVIIYYPVQLFFIFYIYISPFILSVYLVSGQRLEPYKRST